MDKNVLETKVDYILKENNDLKEANTLLQRELENMVHERDVYLACYNSIEKSKFWRITKPIRFIVDLVKKVLRKMKHFLSVYYNLAKKVPYTIKSRGWKYTFKKIFFRGKDSISHAQENITIAIQADEKDIWSELHQHIDQLNPDFIDIFGVPMGWNTPLFQRFQHLSLQAGRVGGISFYGAHPAVDPEVEVYKFVTPELCIVNLDNYQVKKRFFEEMDKRTELKYIRVQSIDLATTREELDAYLSKGYEIVYEYIDEITPQITGNIPEFVLERHKYMLENEDIIAIATSDKLFSQMTPYRSNNMAMINNGVDYEHWCVKKEQFECPDKLKDIVAKGKIIVGYHGALAKWVDYDLLKKIAEDGRYELVLIGFEHDGNMSKSGVLECEQAHFLGPVPYAELNRYAAFYDIAILPFLINDITLSVSPVKIFEYMALQKPVVTYALPECKKYESCLCADTQEEFLAQLEKATNLMSDAQYLELLNKDALDNTWESITRKTVDMVKKYHSKKILMGLNAVQQEKKVIVEDVLNKEFSAEQTSTYMNEVLSIPSQKKDEEYVPLASTAYERKENDPKIIAYYLTQFHPDPHNEEWWGKGVTEWDNVSRAVPQFIGHYQPRFPGELGYYDLRIDENMKRQVELAKMYGIYGFSFYYYWFNGERLLEMPLERFLENKEIDFPFSLCWANENWTKRFDGTNSEVLMEQPTSVESYRNVITDMIRFLNDSRYITVDGKKVITVYRPSLMPEAKKVLEYWRTYCREHGAGELYIIAVKENCVERDWLAEGYDAMSEFHPGTLYTNCKNITNEINYVRDDFKGEVFSYEDIVREKKYFNYNYPKLYRAIMPMWDNTARRNNKGMIFHGATPALYKEWLKDIIIESKNRTDIEDHLLFINAWNEWGEGAYMEPDKKYGYAYLAATREVLEMDICKEI